MLEPSYAPGYAIHAAGTLPRKTSGWRKPWRIITTQKETESFTTRANFIVSISRAPRHDFRDADWFFVVRHHNPAWTSPCMVSNPFNVPVPSSATTGMNEMAFPPLGVIAIIASMAFDPSPSSSAVASSPPACDAQAPRPRARPTDDANPHR